MGKAGEPRRCLVGTNLVLVNNSVEGKRGGGKCLQGLTRADETDLDKHFAAGAREVIIDLMALEERLCRKNLLLG